MEQPTVAMELGETIDITEILSLKHVLEFYLSIYSRKSSVFGGIGNHYG